MSETIEKIIDWHERTFLNATLQGQITKWHNEEKEFQNTIANTEEELYELADMVIVSCGIMRFNYDVGFNFLCRSIENMYAAGADGEQVWFAVERKMAINRKRKWKKQGNSYQHVEE